MSISSSSRSIHYWLMLVGVLLSGAVTIVTVRIAQAGYPPASAGWITVFQYAMLAVVVGGLLVLMVRRATSRMWWEALLSVLAYIGVWHLLALLRLPMWAVLLVASLLTLSQFLLRFVFTHNLFLLCGAAGAAIAVASWVPWDVLAIGLVAFVIYDTVALAPQGAVGLLAERLSGFALVPGVIIPSHPRGLFAVLDDVAGPAGRSSVVFLGVGDILFPLALLAHFAARGAWQGGVVLTAMAIASVIGATWQTAHPRSLLVPLALGASFAALGLHVFSLFV